MSFQIVFQGSIIVLVFAYIALGPYASYYQQVIDQVRTPVEIVFRAVSNAVYDVWLLATNPTEWYARQQVLNARPEKPIDFPKGVEVLSLDALPPSVPGGQQFAITTVISNQGFLQAKDVTITTECNQWCKTSGVEIKPSVARTTLDGSPATIVRNSMERGESEIVTISPIAAQFFRLRAAQTNLAKVKINISYTTSTNSSLQVSVISDGELQERFRKGEAVFKPVTAVSKSTPAQLSLNVGPQPLKQSNPFAGNQAQVSACNLNGGACTPGSLCINNIGQLDCQPGDVCCVSGDQQIRTEQIAASGGKNSALLLVSVSNTRDYSKVILPRGAKIIIRVPAFLIDKPNDPSSFKCGQFTPISQTGENSEYYNSDYSTIVYTVEPRAGQNSVEILAYEFNSIFAFICNFDVTSSVDTLKTGLITAELPSYIFRAEQTKDVPITAPLGILFDPFEQTCNECNGNTLCNADACHLTTGQGTNMGTCYFDNTQRYQCKSCSEQPSCDQFEGQEACKTEASSRCNIPCGWKTYEEIRATGENIDQNSRTFINGGRCEETAPSIAIPKGGITPLQGDLATKIAQAAKEAGVSQNDAQIFFKLVSQESRLRHCCQDPNLNKARTCVESGLASCDASHILTSFDGSSFGVMQLNRGAHPVWYDASESGCSELKNKIDCTVKENAGCKGSTAYNADCNIRIGIRFLIYLKSRGYVNFNCQGKSVTYTDWDAALRRYVGLGCDSAHLNYVESVNNWPVSQYQTVIDYVYSQPTYQAQNTCQGCTSSGQVWCADNNQNTVTGYCIPVGPCQQYTITQSSQCSVPITSQSCSQCINNQNGNWCTSSSQGSSVVGQCMGKGTQCPQQFDYLVTDPFICSTI